MERLTRKTFFGDYALEEDNEKNKNTAYNKLGRVEDFEEKNHISFAALTAALKGIWVKDIHNNNVYFVASPYLCYAENLNRELELQFKVADTWYDLKNYGKTWALTKEELE